jgi:cellulose synthase (UDP-forming)
MRTWLLRLLVLVTATLGINYVVWRWLFSLNWDAWWIAVPLVIAETYSLIDSLLFGLTMWRVRRRGEPDPPPEGATVDVFITTYNEPLDLVQTTALAAKAITHPHQTWLLDDGNRAELGEWAEANGIGWIRRSDDWVDRPRHAKAGNINNALMATDGEFLLILDADQIPEPTILDRTLGYFRDEKVALVQTPQVFTNVPDGDPLGSQAPLFYGPIQQGKDGWNAAFFCGSNAVIRREALMQLGVSRYVGEVEISVHRALRTSKAVLARATKQLTPEDEHLRASLDLVAYDVRRAQRELRRGLAIADVTYRFQQRVDSISRGLVESDLDALRADLAAIEGACPSRSTVPAAEAWQSSTTLPSPRCRTGTGRRSAPWRRYAPSSGRSTSTAATRHSRSCRSPRSRSPRTWRRACVCTGWDGARSTTTRRSRSVWRRRTSGPC